MNQVYETILKRRSIRHFKQQKVEKEKIDILLKAAMSAPSACNLQPWEFVVIDDENVLSHIKEETPLGRYNAPLFILVCGTYKHMTVNLDLWKFDCGLAAQNIMLECVELGLGSVCVAGFDHKAIKEILSIPEDIIPIVFIEIGYPNEEKESLTYYDEQAISYQKFNSDKKRQMKEMKKFDDAIIKKIKSD